MAGERPRRVGERHMRYGVFRLHVGRKQLVELTKERYDEVKDAKERLLAALSVEEKLDLVMENYAEFEVELLQLATRQMLFQGRSWSTAIGELHTINRRL